MVEVKVKVKFILYEAKEALSLTSVLDEGG
jgi:hypothetical protein